jgi:regulatory protein
MLKKGCAEAIAAEVVRQLETERLLSDDRFMESLIQARRNRGYGPLRIQKELQEKGVAPEAIANWLDATSREWVDDIRRVQRKKFGGRIPRSYAERARQARFLQYRGFTYDQIQQLLDPRGQD